MAEKEKDHEGGKAAKKHLHEIRSERTEDGHIIHHHSFKAKKGDTHTEPERKNVAVSSSPEEAGQHVADQMGMAQQQDGGGEGDPSAQGGDPTADASAQAAPGGGAGAPEEMMG